MSMSTPQERRAGLAKVAQGRVDGLILLRPWARRPWLQELAAVTNRIVAVDHTEPFPGGHSLMVDYGPGMTQAVAHLVQLGHQRLGFIGHLPMVEDPRADLRRKAFERAVADARLPLDERWIYDRRKIPAGRCRARGARGRRILGRRAFAGAGAEGPTAWCAFQDLTATGALARCYERDVRVPEYVSLIGIENSQLAEVSVPAMTSIAHPLNEMGRRAVEILITEESESSPTGSVSAMEQTFLVTRGSTASVRREGITSSAI